MGALALLGKLWSYAVNFFARLYGAKMAEADAKYADATQRLSDLQRQLASERAFKEQANEVNDRLSAEIVKLTQENNEKLKRILSLENDLESTKKRITALPSDDVWDARIGANVTPPIGSGGNA